MSATGAAAGLMIAGLVALSGCQTLDFGQDPVPKEGNGSVMDPAEALLAEAALRADRSLALLAKARSAEADLRAPDIPDNVPPELLQRVSMDFIGPLEELARQLAAGAGYALVTAGRPPPAPVMVEIAAEDAPLIRIFGDAGMQAADRALLTVDAGRMTVRLDWFEDRRVEKRPGS
ncbi:MAG: DotD/TraH family lipoprotein [Alphaproteobacteria bacterium]|nr:DotD/TraH family lipoprotein [Alphaproteobacteria bacterium]